MRNTVQFFAILRNNVRKESYFSATYKKGGYKDKLVAKKFATTFGTPAKELANHVLTPMTRSEAINIFRKIIVDCVWGGA